jgi:hypothetical protein
MDLLKGGQKGKISRVHQCAVEEETGVNQLRIIKN